MILVVVSLLMVSALITQFRSYRKPENRKILVEVFKDRRAMLVGSTWMLYVLILGLTSGGLHNLVRNVIPALIGGFAVAAIVNWFSRRRGNSP